MKMTAAVIDDVGSPFRIQEVDLASPGEGEVLVEIVASGLCHTDLAAQHGYIPFPMPAVLGHEGSGIVRAIGAGVHKVAPGDRVIVTYQACENCPNCHRGRPTYCREIQKWIFSGKGRREEAAISDKGRHLGSNFLCQSSFATHVLSTADGLVKVDNPDVPIEMLGPLGCGIATGAGAVLKSLKVPFGASLAVFGCGSVGMAAVMAARASGVGRIIGVDVNPAKLDTAKSLGATHAVNSTTADPVQAIRDITGGDGADYSLWAVGVPEVIDQVIGCLNQTGVAGLVGVAPFGARMSLDIHDIFRGKTVRGILNGDAVADLLFPELIEMYVQGRFPLDKIVTYYEFADINKAAEDLLAGRVIKPIIRMPRRS